MMRSKTGGTYPMQSMTQRAMKPSSSRAPDAREDASLRQLHTETRRALFPMLCVMLSSRKVDEVDEEEQ
jgi:hypothetical protein